MLIQLRKQRLNIKNACWVTDLLCCEEIGVDCLLLFGGVENIHFSVFVVYMACGY